MPCVVRESAPVVWPLGGLLAMWLFGNLYEEIVWVPGVIADPRPGSLAGEFDAGSPVYYYLPWAPLAVVLAVVLLVRFGGRVPLRVRRMWTIGLCLLVAAVAGKVLLITMVNPVFRDPAISPGLVRDTAVLWAVGNGAVVLLVAAAVPALLTWRRAR